MLWAKWKFNWGLDPSGLAASLMPSDFHVCSCFACLCSLRQAMSPVSSCVSAPQSVAHTWLWLPWHPLWPPFHKTFRFKYPVPHSQLSVGIFQFPGEEIWLSRFGLSTVVGWGQLGSYLLALRLRVRWVSMCGEEITGFLWKPTESCNGRAGNDLRKI